MDFDFSFEQQMIAKSVRGMLHDLPPVMDRPPFPYAVSELSVKFAELGLFPEDPAEPVIGLVEAVAIGIEVGRALPAGPVIEQLAASFFVGNAASASIAVSGGGERALVPFAEQAATILLPIDRDGARAWQHFAADDLEFEAVEITDVTGTAAWVNVKPGRSGSSVAGNACVSPDDTLQLVALAETTGSAESVLEKTVAYIAERKQFGKPIGTNQAVKHLAADAASDVEIMKAAVEYAGWALDEARSGDPESLADARMALLTARSFIGEHARLVVERCVQMHGGIAFTWDYGLHRYLRRILYRTNTIIKPMESREALAGNLLGEI